MAQGSKKSARRSTTAISTDQSKSPPAKYPRHSAEKCLRVAKAILDENAGKECTVAEAASFVGVGKTGAFSVEVSSGIKYGFLERPSEGHIAVTDRAKLALRPQHPDDELRAFREAVQSAPVISEVYAHYRGENLPADKFFHNALTEQFGVPSDKVDEFTDVFTSTLRAAQLITENDGKLRVVDITHDSRSAPEKSVTLRALEKTVKVQATDSCFVVMPFSPPIGDYYAKVYKPAIEKAGLRSVRADAEIFATGKIMEQIWAGINSARVLVAELTTRNPNVFYELGLAHALEKPVVLVSSNEGDVPFDLKHIRVIYYDVNDPFWGNKLIDKVAENVLSAIENPEEAVLRRRLEPLA